MISNVISDEAYEISRVSDPSAAATPALDAAAEIKEG